MNETKSLLFDTDVLIDYLRNEDRAVDFLESRNNPFLISVITVAELFAGAREEEIESLNSFLKGFEIISVTWDIAQSGGQIRKVYAQSHGTGLADAIIAATVQSAGTFLVTRNEKHYPMIERIMVPY